MDVIEAIKMRRSVRGYTSAPISDADIRAIIESAVLAPSGKNGQPWKFKFVTNKSSIDDLSSLSIYN